MSIIKDLIQKPETRLVALMILLSTLSFGLGYLFAERQNPAPIVIQKIVNSK